jgi:hypothetical protein
MRACPACGGNRTFIRPGEHGAMPLTRRALLAAALACPVAARAAAPASLRPGTRSDLRFAPLPQERLAFRATGLEPAITLPAPRARLAALLPIAGRQVAVLAFGADPSAAALLDLAAVVGWDGARLRVLALEVLRWQAPGGAWLGTRILATGDRNRLELLRDAAAPRGGRPWRREGWTDLLAWRDGGSLADEPVRVPLPDTFQAGLATIRARVAAHLVQPRQDVGEDLIGLIVPEALPPT